VVTTTKLLLSQLKTLNKQGNRRYQTSPPVRFCPPPLLWISLGISRSIKSMLLLLSHWIYAFSRRLFLAIICKRDDVIYKNKNILDVAVATPPEEDWATTINKMHRNGEDLTHSSGDMLADRQAKTHRQTHGQTDMLVSILGSPNGGGVTTTKWVTEWGRQNRTWSRS